MSLHAYNFKIQTQVTSVQYKAIKNLAQSNGLKMAELIRRWILIKLAEELGV